MSRATDMVSCGTLWAFVVRWCGSKESVGGCRSPRCLTGRSRSYVMLLSTAAAGHEAPSSPPVKHVSVFQGPRARANQEDVFLRCAATSSSHSGLSYLWTTIILKKTWLKREIVLLLTFSRSWVQCFISYNPNVPSLAMHHRAEETFTLSWLLMRSTAVPRWSKVTDEPGWTTWQSGAGMDWMEWKNTRVAHRHQVSLLPSLYDSEKYWMVLVHFIYYYYFSTVLLHVAAS